MNENEETITLTDEDGNSSEYYVIGEIEYGGKTYVAFEPVENEDDEYVILRVENDEEGEVFATIDDDDEFEAVAHLFEEEYMGEYDLDEDEDTEDGEGENN